MTMLARHADKAEPLALYAEDDLARSAAIVRPTGYQLVTLGHSIGPGVLLGTSSQELLLVSIVWET